jgi:hypothetical protein
MAERIDTGEGRDARRLGERQFGIEQGDPAGGALVSAGHFHVRLRVADQGEGLGLAAGAGGGGHGDHGQHGAGGFAHTPIIAHAAATRIEEVNALGAIHGAAAPQSDEQFGPAFASQGQSGLHVGRGGIGVDGVEDGHFDAGAVQCLCAASGMAGGHHAGIADQERAPRGEFQRQGA